jgi:hypothetical protein
VAVHALGQSSVTPKQTGETGAMKTHKQLNGRFWKSLNHRKKSVFISGYFSATDYIMLLTNKDYQTYKKVSQSFCPPSLNVGEVDIALDRFYETPENTPIPIPQAIWVISERTSGADEAAVQKEITDLRKLATKD